MGITTGRLMRCRVASLNDQLISVPDCLFHWPEGRRPDSHPGLSASGLRLPGSAFLWRRAECLVAFGIQSCEIFIGERDICGGDILFQMGDLGRAWDR